MRYAALSKSLHGRAISCVKVTPAMEVVHQLPGVTLDPAVAHELLLTISNPGNAPLKVEVHYNNGASYHEVPAYDSIEVRMTCEGDSPACEVANANVAVALSTGQDPGQVNVTGGYRA